MLESFHTLRHMRLSLKPKEFIKQLTSGVKHSLENGLHYLEGTHHYSAQTTYNDTLKKKQNYSTLTIKPISPKELMSLSSLSSHIDHDLEKLTHFLSDETYTLDSFLNDVQDLSHQLKRLEESTDPDIVEKTTQQKAILLSTTTQIFHTLNTTITTPESGVHAFFESYEDIQHAIEYISSELKTAHNELMTHIDLFSKNAVEIDPSAESKTAIRTHLLHDVSAGFITTRTLPYLASLSPYDRQCLCDDLIQSGVARLSSSGNIQLNPESTVEQIKSYTPKNSELIRSTQLDVSTHQLQNQLLDLKNAQFSTIMLGLNRKDYQHYKLKIDPFRLKNNFNTVMTQASDTSASIEAYKKQAMIMTLTHYSPLMRSVIEAHHDKTVISGDPKHPGQFEKEFMSTKGLKRASSNYNNYNKMLHDFCCADQQGRTQHATVVDLADLLKPVDLVVPSSKDALTHNLSSLTQLDAFLNDIQTYSNIPILKQAHNVHTTINSIKSSFNALENKYHIKQKTHKEQIKKIAYDVANGTFSPVLSPLKIMRTRLSKKTEHVTSAHTLSETAHDFAAYVGNGVKDVLKTTFKWLSGPIGEGFHFLYHHTQQHDLPEALGRCWDDLPSISRATRRYEGKLGPDDFCDLPPLGGKIASSKEISEFFYTSLLNRGLIRHDGSVDHDVLFTHDINLISLEHELTQAIYNAYEHHKSHTTEYKHMSAEDKHKQASEHAKELLKHAIEKLKIISSVKGNLYIASEAQDALETIKNTAGWIGAVSAGIATLVMPITFIAIGLITGGVSLFAASTKVFGGIAQSNLAEKQHTDMFQHIPYDRLNDIGREEYANSRAHILSIQDQVISDFTQGASMLVSMGKAPSLGKFTGSSITSSQKEFVKSMAETVSSTEKSDHRRDDILTRQHAAQGWRHLIQYVKGQREAKQPYPILF